MAVRKPEPIIKNIGEKLSREDRIALTYINQVLPEKLKNEDCIINSETKTLMIGKDTYHYKVQIVNNNAYINVKHIYRINENLYEIELFHKRVNLSHKLKTKKGKTNISLRKLFYLLGMAATVVTSVEVIEQLTTKREPIVIESVSSMKNPNMNQIIIPAENSLDATAKYESDSWVADEKTLNDSIVNSIDLVVDFEKTDDAGYDKRAETEVLFGEDIKHFANRYGLDTTLAYCHFTFERSNNPSHSIEKRKNIGQLTTAICGEKIIAPVYENGQVVDYDKYYLLPPATYESYSELKALGLEMQKKDSSLEIIEWNAIYGQEMNIKLSLAYLSYIINSKKHDLVRGVMAYNAGYGSVKDSYSYEDILNGTIAIDDPFYWKHILQYLYPEEYEAGFTVYINGNLYNYKVIKEEKKNEENYEKENGYHL